MTFAIGDPAHINLGHNDLLALIQEQADRFMVTVTLPDTAGLGDTGHVDDHNLIVAALQAIADAPGGASPPVVDEGASTNVTFSTLTDPDGDGKNYRLARWTTNGTLSVTTAGAARVLCAGPGMAGHPGGDNAGGDGGSVFDGSMTLPSGSLAVTIGSAVAWQAQGYSEVGSLVRAHTVTKDHSSRAGDGAMGAGSGATPGVGLTSTITGASVEYGKGGPQSGGATPAANTGGGGVAAAAGSAGVVCIRWEV